MNQQAYYADSRFNPYITPHMQHMPAQNVQSYAGPNNLPGHPDSFSAENKTLSIEGQLQLDRCAPNVSNRKSSHAFNEVQGSNGTRSYYQVQTLDPKLSLKTQANQDLRDQPHEQDMEIGYEDNPPPPLTFEGLEQKFIDEFMTLSKEQSDAENAEFSRHKEKLLEINTKFQEKISALRAQQSARREEFLRKESQSILHQYQQGGKNHYSGTGLPDAHGHISIPVNRPYATGQFDPHREQSQYLGSGRTQATEARIPFPAGRVYNTSSKR
ncbi:Ubiquitin carboxyl-terminal hydrolase [Quillaja saponaria]|nr:Ubiquitin carboxyl-terminal hydrolase [Quillaja saponaria]